MSRGYVRHGEQNAFDKIDRKMSRKGKKDENKELTLKEQIEQEKIRAREEAKKKSEEIEKKANKDNEEIKYAKGNINFSRSKQTTGDVKKQEQARERKAKKQKHAIEGNQTTGYHSTSKKRELELNPGKEKKESPTTRKNHFEAGLVIAMRKRVFDYLQLHAACFTTTEIVNYMEAFDNIINIHNIKGVEHLPSVVIKTIIDKNLNIDNYSRA